MDRARGGDAGHVAPATIAEFEADLARAGAREGMAVAKADSLLRDKQPGFGPARENRLVDFH